MDLAKTGGLIASARKEKGLTQKQLADRLHVSDRTVSKWERGAGFPDVSLLTPLADALGLSVTELLQGSRCAGADTELSVREAVALACQQAKKQTRKHLASLLAGALALALLLLSGVRLYRRLSEDRIFFPPDVSCQVLLNEGELEGSFLLKRSNSGLYHRTCRYELTQYGGTRLLSRDNWQSYEATVPGPLYQQLRSLSGRELLEVRRTDGGWLASYYTYDKAARTERYELIETDPRGEPLFTYAFTIADEENRALAAAYSASDDLYLLFREDSDRSYTCRAVDRESGAEREVRFPHERLAGGSEGSFFFGEDRLWLGDGAITLADTLYDRGSSAVVASFGLEDGRTRFFSLREGAELMAARREGDRLQVLVNPKHYAALSLLTYDLNSGRVPEEVSLELPHEFLADLESGYESYYLNVCRIDEGLVTVLFPVRGGPEGECQYVLTGYDSRDGRMVYRSRLSLDAGYEIYELCPFAPESYWMENGYPWDPNRLP